VGAPALVFALPLVPALPPLVFAFPPLDAPAELEIGSGDELQAVVTVKQEIRVGQAQRANSPRVLMTAH